MGNITQCKDVNQNSLAVKNIGYAQHAQIGCRELGILAIQEIGMVLQINARIATCKAQSRHAIQKSIAKLTENGQQKIVQQILKNTEKESAADLYGKAIKSMRVKSLILHFVSGRSRDQRYARTAKRKNGLLPITKITKSRLMLTGFAISAMLKDIVKFKVWVVTFCVMHPAHD